MSDDTQGLGGPDFEQTQHTDTGPDDAAHAETADGFGVILEQAQATEEYVEQNQRRDRIARRARRRRRIRYALLSTTVTVSLVVAAGFVYLAYDAQHLTRNLKHTALLPVGVTEPPEQVDAFGRSAINILLLGSDTRSQQRGLLARRRLRAGRGQRRC